LDSEVPVSAIRWERRRLVLLRVVLLSAGGDTATPHLTRAFEFVVDKVRSFGGRIEAWSATAVVAAVGLEPGDDVPGRAAHAALAIQIRAERARGADPEQPAVAMAIHAGQLMVGQAGSVVRVDADEARGAQTVLDGLLDPPEPDTIMVSGAGAVL